MSDFRDTFLPALDQLRGIPGQFGLRLFTVAVFVRTWTGERAGIGTSSDTTTLLTVDNGCQPPKVRALTTREVGVSGGLYRDGDYEIGPLTPPYPCSLDNVTLPILDPVNPLSPIEVFWKLTGPSFPQGTAYCEKISQLADKPFRYTIVVRATAYQP